MAAGILLYVGLGLLFALGTVPATRAIARRTGFVAKPRADRWHSKPTALMGGVGIIAAFLVAWGIAHFRGSVDRGGLLVACAVSMGVLGFVDDIVQLKPYAKLVFQLLAAITLTSFGNVLPWTPWMPVNHAITVFWLVGVTNALNLLDNIDGLSAGIASIAGLFMAYFFHMTGQDGLAVVLACFSGATLGFLVFNFHPASIFMGDSGSLFLGFLLGGAALYQNTHRSRGLVAVLAPPVLILAIPILDTTLVTITRKLHGRSVSQGGRDHTSHRLVALGLSERDATLTLYGLAVLSGICATVAFHARQSIAYALIPAFAIAIAIVAAYLGRVKVYAPVVDENKPAKRALLPTLADFSYKRRIFEVIFDFTLILLAYYSAFLLRFDGDLTEPFWQRFTTSIPVLAGAQMALLLATGLYGGLWRYTSLADLRRIFTSSVVAAIGGVAAVAIAFRGLAGFSRAVFIIDGMLVFLFLAGLRVSFRVIRDWLVARMDVQQRRRVIIYGAGDAGELLLREIRNNGDLNLLPVGFVDDDPQKEGVVIHGLRVLGSGANLANLLPSLRVQEIVLSTGHIDADRLAALDAVCEHGNVKLRRARIDWH